MTERQNNVTSFGTLASIPRRRCLGSSRVPFLQKSAQQTGHFRSLAVSQSYPLCLSVESCTLNDLNTRSLWCKLSNILIFVRVAPAITEVLSILEILATDEIQMKNWNHNFAWTKSNYGIRNTQNSDLISASTSTFESCGATTDKKGINLVLEFERHNCLDQIAGKKNNIVSAETCSFLEVKLFFSLSLSEGKKKRTRKGENYSFLPSPSPSPLGALRGLQVKLDKSLNFEVLVKIMKRYE